MEASCFFTYNIANLSQVRVYDNSIYDTLTPYDINATRILFSTVNTRNNIDEDVTELIAFKEYIVTSGSTMINRMPYSVGDIIYLANDTTPTGTFTIAETGYYGIRSTYLPVEPYVAYTPSQMIYGQTGLYYPDNVITCRYELFSTKYEPGSITVSGDTTFIVIGDQGGLIRLGNHIFAPTFYVGEVFTVDYNFDFENLTGDNQIVQFEAETEKNFRTWYQNWTLWSSYFNTISTSYQVSQSFLASFLGATARINQCAMYENQDFNTSLQSVQDLMNDVNDNYQIK